jgi:hypothetical protein
MTTARTRKIPAKAPVKTPAKAAPAKKAAARKPGANSATRVAQLETRVEQLEWCFAEQVWKSQVAAIRQALANPAVQEQLAAQFLAQQQ